MFGKPTHPAAAARAAVFGVLAAMMATYCLVYAPELLRGDHVLDFAFIRNLSLLGLLVIGYGWWENRG